MPELAEQHGDELGPTAKAARVALGLMLLDPGLKLQARDELQNLAEDARYSIHGGKLRIVQAWFLMRTQAHAIEVSAIPAHPLQRSGQKLIWTGVFAYHTCYYRFAVQTIAFRTNSRHCGLSCVGLPWPGWI